MENLFRTKRQLPPLFLRQILEYTFARTLNDDKYFKEVEGEGIEKKTRYVSEENNQIK